VFFLAVCFAACLVPEAGTHKTVNIRRYVYMFSLTFSYRTVINLS
jgi:hypothetical protein